jgi:hypothetical protein
MDRGRGSWWRGQFGRRVLGTAVHGEVMGARGDEVAGEANECNRRGEKVCRARGEVVELKSYTNLTRTQHREEGGSSPEMKMTATLAQSSSRKGGRGGRGRGEEGWSSGGPFYRHRGRRKGRWRAPTTLGVAAMIAHSGGDGMAQADGVTGWLGQTQGAKPSW